jgi:hypothetical protein
MAGPTLSEAPSPPLRRHHPQSSECEREAETILPQVQLDAYGVGRMGSVRWSGVCVWCGGSGGESEPVASRCPLLPLFSPTPHTHRMVHTRAGGLHHRDPSSFTRPTLPLWFLGGAPVCRGVCWGVLQPPLWPLPLPPLQRPPAQHTHIHSRRGDTNHLFVFSGLCRYRIIPPLPLPRPGVVCTGEGERSGGSGEREASGARWLTASSKPPPLFFVGRKIRGPPKNKNTSSANNQALCRTPHTLVGRVVMVLYDTKFFESKKLQIKNTNR